jgi:hypothetical protein
LSHSLLTRAADPGWTPSARELPALLAALAASPDDAAPTLERALLRRAAEAGPLAVAALPTASPAGKVRLLRLLGRLITSGAAPAGGSDAAVAALVAPEPAVRRQAARALGGLRDATDATVGALAAALDSEDRPDVRRALIDALGKLGGEVAAAALAAVADDAPATAARLERARLAATRAAHRPVASHVDPTARPPAPIDVIVHCRRGLAPLVADELRGVRPRILDDARVAVRLAASPLAPLAASRMMLRLGIPLATPRATAADPAAAIVAALAAPATRALLAALTVGPIRYRLAWDDGAHRRALTLRIATGVAAAAPELVNDPSEPTWQVRLALAPALAIELEPRRLPDERFAYRVRDVPAASHPTIAAALARLAVQHAAAPAADVVWDPFVGSGQELVERARAAPVAELFGTDVSADALAAAGANLAAAGVTAVLTRADAVGHRIPGLTCIITNPPMGRRVARGTARALLERFVDHAAAALSPGGVLVWISPFGRDTDARAAAAGLELVASHTVDLGGFDGELQVLRRSAPGQGQQRAQDRGRPELSRGSDRPGRRTTARPGTPSRRR